MYVLYCMLVFEFMKKLNFCEHGSGFCSCEFVFPNAMLMLMFKILNRL